MKRLFLSFALALFALSALPLSSVECGGGATVAMQPDGAYRITFPKSDSWPSVRFAIPDQEWGKGKVAITVKAVSPLDKPGLPASITVLSTEPHGAIESRYINRELRGATPVRLEFAQAGDKKPRFLMIAAKAPGAETIIEVTKLEIGQKPPPKIDKVRQSLFNPGTPHDNAVAEALKKTVGEYIDFYNQKRPHRKLKLQSPNQFAKNDCDLAVNG